MKKLLATLGLAASVFTLSHSAHASTSYTVKSGDSLYKLSKTFHVSIQSLKRVNHLSGDLIRTGTHLTIPAGVASSRSTSRTKTSTVSLTDYAYMPTYKVKSGDTFWKIAMRTGSPVATIKSANPLNNGMLKVGQILHLPEKFTNNEKILLEKLVTAESKGEPYAGQVAVTTVILNRVDSPQFPNSLKGVIFQKTGSHYAFTPVKTGSINQSRKPSVIKAVNEALAMHPSYKKTGSLYYYNPRIITNSWILSQPITARIGHQVFAR